MRHKKSAVWVPLTLATFISFFPQLALAGISLGAYGSWGSIKDSNLAIPSVKESTVGAYLLPSYELISSLGFGIGLYGEYDRVGQLTAVTSASGYNKSYSGYLGGGAVVFTGSLFRLSGAYTFLGKGTLDKKTSAGLTTTLEDPKGLHLILSMKMSPLLSLDLGYTTVKYDVLVGSVSSNQTRTIYDYRLGGSINF